MATPKHSHGHHDDGHGHHGHHHSGHKHHVLSARMLVRVFVALVGLTVLTVVLALFERGFAQIGGTRIDLPQLHLGALSVPVALAIAGAKATLVAAYFMNLREDRGTPLLSFVASFVFLIIFFAFTYLDTGFRDTFTEQSAIPVDVYQEQLLEGQARTEALAPDFEAVPLVDTPDPRLFPNAALEPGAAAATPAAPADTPADDGTDEQ